MSTKLGKEGSYGAFIQCNVMGALFKNEIDLCTKMRQDCQSIVSDRRQDVIHLKLPEWVSKMGKWLFGRGWVGIALLIPLMIFSSSQCHITELN